MIKERENKTLELVREIGFDNTFGVGKKPTERIFFMGASTAPWTGREGEISDHATPEAIAEFIDYWEHQIAVAKDYVANGCNADTTAWKKQDAPANRSCEYEQTLLLRFCEWLSKQNLLPNAHEAEIQTAYFIGRLSQDVSTVERLDRIEALKCALVNQRGRDTILANKYDRAVVLEFAEWWTNHRDRLHIPPGKREVDQFFVQRKP